MPMLSIQNSELFYQDVGNGPVLLFGHSYLWNHQMWQPQIQELSQYYRCIVPDLWEHGQSQRLPKTHSIHDIAEHHHQLMLTLGLTEFAVIGLSIGGMWGADLAIHHPENVKALILMDTFVGLEPEITRNKYFALLDAIETHGFSQPIVDTIVPYFFSPKTMQQQPKPAIVNNFKQALTNIPPTNIPGVARIGRAIFSRESLLDQLSTLQIPVKYIVGEDDIPRPPHESQQMAELTHNAELAVIKNAGHISTLENPGAVTTEIIQFLKKHF